MAAKPETGTPPLPRRRALQAEQTRRDILAAARRRFAEHGYAATTLKDIATDTGVSVQTIYDSVGNKPELVRQLNDLIDAEAQIGEIVAPLLNETDPLVVARAPARITRRLIERCGDILRAGLAGSYTDDGLAPALEVGVIEPVPAWLPASSPRSARCDRGSTPNKPRSPSQPSPTLDLRCC